MRDCHSVKAMPPRPGARKKASAPNEFAQLLLRVVSALPPETHVLVLSHLCVPELARLACVHKAFRVAWKRLQKQQPGSRYAPPSAYQIVWIKPRSRLERAGSFGDVPVLRSMLAAGVDEHGSSLRQCPRYWREVVGLGERGRVRARGGHGAAP